MKRLRSIQVLRGVAACGVVLLHARFTAPIDFSDSWARLGAAGVDLFFVISGFIMASIAKPSAKQFLLDRFWRVMPLWWISAIPWLLLKPQGWETTVATLTLWPVFDEFTKPVGVGWTLCFEALFYLSVVAAMRFGWKLLATLFGLCLIGGILTSAAFFDWTGNPIIIEFLFGVMIAKLPRDERFGLPMIAAAAFIFAVSPLYIYEADIAIDASASWVRPIFWGFPAGLLVYGCLTQERFFKWRLPQLLGDASYSIYLVHLPIILVVNLWWPVEALLGVASGIILWRFVERPILTQRTKFAVSVKQLPPIQGDAADAPAA